MVIGIDAGALSIVDERLKVGVYRVIFNLVRELSRLGREDIYRLYSFAPIDPAVMEQFGYNVDNIVLTPQKGWFSWRLPLSVFFHPVDIFLGVSQAMPLSLSKGIGFIYDLGFLYHKDAYPTSYERLVSQTNALIRRSSHIVTISQASKNDIMTHYSFPEKAITVSYPGVDARFSPNGPTYKGNTPYFLHVGSLKPGKNIPTLIKAFAQFLRRSRASYLLVIIGGNYWMDEEIMKTIASCGVEESVRLLGYVPDEILPEYYRGATAFVSASLREGFCIPVLEAMSCGCPVLASNTGAFPEVAPDPTLLVDPKDVTGFCGLMGKITMDEELRKVAIATGIAKSERYSWLAFSQNVLDVIRSNT